MLSTPRHPFLEAIFASLLEKARGAATKSGGELDSEDVATNVLTQSPVDATGPMMLAELYEGKPEAYADVALYPSNIFYPLVDDEHKYDTVNGEQNCRWKHIWVKD